ncbi:MAG: putative Ig domain-containing protein [Acidobacteriaceae bacterium]|nr:putative Ig domain-containing protein [Acidobacteriaceae bacterium]
MRRLYRFIALFVLTTLSASLAFGQTTAQYSALYSLNSATDGQSLYGHLIQAADGNLWGMSWRAGTGGYGVIFKITTAGVFTPVYSFSNGASGYYPEDSLIQGTDGNFYGTTYLGGNPAGGVIFKLTPSGVYTVLHSFTKATDGSGVFATLVEGTDGALYGTASGGGSLSFGTVFKMTKDGNFTTLHTFTGMNADESNPYVGMIQGDDGLFYGTTNTNETGDTNYFNGSVFSMTADGQTFTTLHHFLTVDGGGSDGALVEGPDGSFYGANHNYGLFLNGDDETGQGSVYKVAKDGTLTVLHLFTGANGDSGRPEGQLTLGTDGNFYGTTTESPSTVYQITPTGTKTILKTMTTSATDGTDPLAAPIFGADGNLYGVAGGGANGVGLIYKAVLTPSVAAPVQLALSASTVTLGGSATLNWTVTNAFSDTMRMCAAFVQNNAVGGGTWTGVQTGVVAGTLWQGQSTIVPTQSGTFTYALTCGGTESGFATLTVPAMTATAPTLSNATVGSAYSASFTTSNGLSPLTWSVSAGALPPGLTVNSSNGAISGTPTLAGTYSFTVTVGDSETSPATFSFPLTLTVTAATPTVVGTPSSFTLTAGQSANAMLALSNFTSSAFTITCAGLPAGSVCTPGTVAGSVGSNTLPLSITTQRSLALVKTQSNGLMLAFAFPGTLAILLAFRRRSMLVRSSALAVLLLGMGFGLSGCSDSPAKTTTYGTPTGSSTVTVTATAGTQTATTTITMTVQ